MQSISILDNDSSDGGDGGNDNGGGDDNGQDGDSAAVIDLAGTWNVTEIADETNCGEGINTKNYTVTLTQNGTSVKAQTPYGTFNGSINGQQATWSGLGSEDGGTLDTNIRGWPRQLVAWVAKPQEGLVRRKEARPQKYKL